MTTASLMEGPESLSGEILGIVFRNEENGFSVLRLRVAGRSDPVVAVGATLAKTGEIVTARGRWKKDPKFGLQFAADSIVASKPTTPTAITRYLSTGVIPGIGAGIAQRLVAKFGAATLDIMENAPERLAEVRGVGKALIQRVKDGWAEQRAAQEILVFLAGQDVGTATALRIFRKYGAESIAVIQANPYRLAAEIKGIGFLTADSIAKHLGVPPASPQRIEAGLRYAIREVTAGGHCGIGWEAFLRRAGELLGLRPEVVEPVLDGLLDQQDSLVPVTLGSEDVFVFERRLFDAEKRVARALRDMLGIAPPWAIKPEAAEAIADDAESGSGVTLAPEQRHAVHMALTSRVSILTGGPGTGKTSTLQVILAALKHQDVRARVLMGAPTGKAAKRMREATGGEASTVARLIGMGQGGEGDREIDCDILILDEASMVDVAMLDRVLICLRPGAAMLFVGDVDQLPSVGAGRVLADLIESQAVPTTRLTQVFRQAATSAIVRNAHRINRGETIEPADPEADFHFVPANDPEAITRHILSLIQQRIPARYGFGPEDIQILSPMRRTPTGTVALNGLLQQALNPTPAERVQRGGLRFGVGDRVLQTVNNYDLRVMNGESGIIRSLDHDQDVARVEIDGEEVEYPFADLDQLDLAYAMTVHKSQGSQFPAVIVPMTTQHYMMLQRPILYTAITRATKLCVVVGQRKALDMAIRNSRMEPRVTSLLYRLSRSV